MKRWVIFFIVVSVACVISIMHMGIRAVLHDVAIGFMSIAVWELWHYMERRNEE